MENPKNTNTTDLKPAIEGNKKNPLPYVKFIVVFLVGILAAKGIFLILDKKVIKQKTTQAKPISQVTTKIIRSSEEYKSSIKNTVSKSKEAIRKKVSVTSAFRSISFPELTLNGIASSGESGWAIINGRVVKPGDKIKGAEIVAITEEKVYLDFNDESFTLTLD